MDRMAGFLGRFSVVAAVNGFGCGLFILSNPAILSVQL